MAEAPAARRIAYGSALTAAQQPPGGASAAEIPGAIHRYARASGITLHYVEAGPADGDPVVLLHGFPELHYGWRHQIPALAAAGFRVIAPDMRGYNLSERPRGVGSYRVETLARDVSELIASLGAPYADVVGHDWGAVVAYETAMRHPERVRRLAILNVPHMQRMLQGMRTLRQLRKSWYVFFFQIPRLPEWLFGRDDFSIGKRSLRAGSPKGTFTDEDLDIYVKAWSQPGALTAMLAYYRATMRRSPRATLAAMRPIAAPTLVIWGQRDLYLGSELAEPDRRWVPDVRVERIPDAGHFVQHERPERVNELLISFLGQAGPPGGS